MESLRRSTRNRADDEPFRLRFRTDKPACLHLTKSSLFEYMVLFKVTPNEFRGFIIALYRLTATLLAHGIGVTGDFDCSIGVYLKEVRMSNALSRDDCRMIEMPLVGRGLR